MSLEALHADMRWSSFLPSCPESSSGNPLQRQRDALADADAHGGQAPAPAAPAEFDGDVGGEPRAGHAERMAIGDRAAVRVDVLGIVGEAELAQAGERLAGEGLVELDQVEIGDAEAKPLR